MFDLRSRLRAPHSRMSGYAHGTEHPGHHLISGYVFGLCLKGEYDAMPENVRRQGSHVFGYDVGAFSEKSVRARSLRQGNRSPG